MAAAGLVAGLAYGFLTRPLYRATGDVSAYAYLERRFGLWARLYALTFYLLTQLARMGTIFTLAFGILWLKERLTRSEKIGAALAVIETLEQDQLIDNAGATGTRMLQAFRERLGAAPGVVAIRGKGLMIGIELDRPCAEVMQQALARKLLINVTADSVVRLLPPLTLTHEQAQTIVATVSELIETFLGDPQ